MNATPVTEALDYIAEVSKGTPSAVIVHSPNPLDDSTPVGVPLSVSGWGRNAANIDYPTVTGFNQISQTEDDEYFILKHVGHDNTTNRYHVMRVSHDHSRLMKTTRFTGAIAELREWEEDYED